MIIVTWTVRRMQAPLPLVILILSDPEPVEGESKEKDLSIHLRYNMHMSYYVYILTNKSNTLYIGVTNNLERRINEHSFKYISSFTSKYNLNKLVFYQEFTDIEDAIAAEKKVKGWTRRKKMELIKTINPEFKDLSNP